MAIHKLSARKVDSANKPGLHGDGGGLYLQVTRRLDGEVSKSWIFRFTWGGRERKCGLGSLDAVSLADARTEAEKCRSMVKRNLDPIAERAKLKAAQEPSKRPMTFEACAMKFMAAKESEWSNATHRQQWRLTLKQFAYPVIGRRFVSDVDLPAVLRILEPIWESKRETASRLRGRIEAILDWAKVQGFSSGENPARWKGNLEHLLAKRNRRTDAPKRHAAMPFADVPEFVRQLRAEPRQDTINAALEFTILTAARNGEVIGARWAEIDLPGKVWTVPGERIKAGKEHRVPLCQRCIEILESMKQMRRNDWVFPSDRTDVGLGENSIYQRFKEMRPDLTVHGFRAAFRTWAGDCTNFAREVCEAALAHTVGDETERAYQRGDLFEKRRLLMESWAQHIANPPGGNVVPFGRTGEI
jgi:integrase